MTTDAIRRKIAEACGWTRAEEYDGILIGPISGDWMRSEAWKRQGFIRDFSELPNYPESHDAMQEALETLSKDDVSKYVIKLAIVLIREEKPRHWEVQARLVLATPIQKAEAFLKAKGLWEDAE